MSFFNKKTCFSLFISLCSLLAFKPIRAQQVQDFCVQHAGTLALVGVAAYAGAWCSDFRQKINAVSYLGDYFKVRNPYYGTSNTQELPHHILLYGTSENKLKDAQSYANVPFPTIVLSARELQNENVPELFKAVSLLSDYYSWGGLKNPRIPIIITSIENFSNRTYGNHELSNLLQAIENNPQVPVIGITDEPSFLDLDGALIRPGRLDHHICLNSGEMKTSDIQGYIRQDILVEAEGIKNSFAITSQISADGITKALKKWVFL